MNADKPDPEERQRLSEKAIEILRRGRPAEPPLLFYLNPLVDWMEDRHIALIRAGSFPEARRAFNPVFIHLPAEGCRLTELARRAHMTKQAMAEIVDELVALGYLVRFPDPADGRAKIILRSDKGLAAHADTLDAFARIETELAALLEAGALDELRQALAEAVAAIRAADGA
jgi:DNA-binding MarR family transcriptional regulator